MSVGTYIGNSHVRYRGIIAAHALFLFAIYKYTSELTDTGKFNRGSLSVISANLMFA